MANPHFIFCVLL